MDQSDIENNRVPLRHAQIDPAAAQARLAAQRRNRPAVEETPPTPGEGTMQQPPETGETSQPPEPGGALPDDPDAQGHEDPDVERIKEQLGSGAFRSRMESIERKAVARLPGLMRRQGGKAGTLAEAAEILLAEMQPNHQDQVRNAATDLNWPVWAVVLGAVAHMADLQELANGNVEEAWINDGETRTRKLAVTKCELCKGVIPTPLAGQRFCCSAHGVGKDAHSDGCPCSHVVKARGEWLVIDQLKS